MGSEVGEILRVAGLHLMMEVMPRMGTEFEQRTVLIMGSLLEFCAQEQERAAEVRVRENEAMRAIFREAQGGVSDGALAKTLSDAAEMRDESLEIGKLDEVNYALKRVLMELHIFCEGEDSQWSRGVEDEIWRCYRLMADGRMIDLPAM